MRSSSFLFSLSAPLYCGSVSFTLKSLEPQPLSVSLPPITRERFSLTHITDVFFIHSFSPLFFPSLHPSAVFFFFLHLFSPLTLIFCLSSFYPLTSGSPFFFKIFQGIVLFLLRLVYISLFGFGPFFNWENRIS